jgi:hypothetical protein
LEKTGHLYFAPTPGCAREPTGTATRTCASASSAAGVTNASAIGTPAARSDEK